MRRDGEQALDLEALRVRVYANFAGKGLPGTARSLARQLNTTAEDVDEGLRRLHKDRHVVLDDDGAIVMAHPFAAIPLGFSAMGGSTLWWGGCAWDSFALPHLLADEREVLVATTCPGCASALSWVVGDLEPPTGEEVAHFLVPVARMWEDVVTTCGNQRLFCDDTCVERWLDHTGHDRGYVMGLSTLWRLASHWYDGRLAYGYTRRDPTTAAAYFADVGLRGEFWGVPVV